MKERPILFSGPMIRAILEGRKTQTRRIVKWQGPRGFPHSFDQAFLDNPAGVKRLCVPYHHPQDPDLGPDNPAHRHYPVHGEPGDRLWVKETFQTGEFAQNEPRGPVYRATDPAWGAMPGWKWKPAIFCTREASRITLEIIKVRVERLQNISAEDALAEGIDHYVPGVTAGQRGEAEADPVAEYRQLWEHINGPRTWAQHPWVWVIEFKRVT